LLSKNRVAGSALLRKGCSSFLDFSALQGRKKWEGKNGKGRKI
jgi:hypothetical protein